eukprot:3616387-Alexandrium_andersonii.AAC.1
MVNAPPGLWGRLGCGSEGTPWTDELRPLRSRLLVVLTAEAVHGATLLDGIASLTAAIHWLTRG